MSFGLTTTDPELQELVDPDWGAERISNLYESFTFQLRDLLRKLGLSSIQELRGRIDLLKYCGGSNRGEPFVLMPNIEEVKGD